MPRDIDLLILNELPASDANAGMTADYFCTLTGLAFSDVRPRFRALLRQKAITERRRMSKDSIYWRTQKGDLLVAKFRL